MSQKNSSKGERERRDSSQGKISPLLEEQAVVTYVSVPPDGGWGWVVVAAAFCCTFFVDGIINTTGLYIGRIDEELKVSKASVALMGSILAGFNLIVGPFVSALVNRYGFRKMCMVGGMVASTGFAASSFATRMEVLWFTYGTVGGFGLGLIFMPSVVVIGFYFERWRSTATCVAVVGSGVGTIVLAPVTSYLLDNFGWRNTMLAQAGMILTCSIYGLLYRPLDPVEISVPCNTDDDIEDEVTGDERRNTVTSNNIPILLILKPEMKEAPSKNSILSDNSMTSPQPLEVNSFLKVGHNAKYATVHEVLQESRCNIKTFFDKSNLSINKSNENVVKKKTRFDVTSFKDYKPMEQTESKNKPNIVLKVNENSISGSTNGGIAEKHAHSYRRYSIQKLPSALTILDNQRNSFCLQKYNSEARRFSERRVSRVSQTRRASVAAGGRPIYRDDIFLQVNPSRIPQCSSMGSGLDYTMQVTRLPTSNELLEEESSTCKLCPEAVKRTLATMLDINLLASPSFLLLCISGFFTNMGYYVPYMFLESRVKDAGMDPDVGKWLISTIGISNTIGRIACGVFTSSPRVSSLLINNVLLTLGGIATIFSGLYMTVNYQLLYAATFGFSVSAFSALRSIIIVDLIGLENLTNGYGLMLLCKGVSAVIGSPIAGFIMDQTQSFDVTFILTGGVILLSGVICYPLAWLNTWEKERKSKKHTQRGQVA